MWPSPSSSLKALRVTRRSLMLLLLLANINIGVFVVYYRGNSTKTNCRSPSLDQFEKGIKTILIWNSANRIETAVFGTGSRPFVEHGCPYTKCRIDLAGRDSLPLESYDAIVINMNELWFAIKEVWPLLPRFIRRLQLPRCNHFHFMTRPFRSLPTFLFAAGREGLTSGSSFSRRSRLLTCRSIRRNLTTILTGP